MAKQQACQKFIFKIHSSRLRRSRWKLDLPLNEARRNNEVISLADSQVLRWIDELNGVVDADAQAREIKRRIRQIKKEPNSPANKKEIRQLYTNLDKLQFKPDYMSLIIDKEKDYWRACKGFFINGVKYKRLLGTNGGIKNSTIVFVSERLHDELERRIENGRDPSKELVTAKLEAYRALSCSASIPVSMPHGILVVPDCETKFYDDITYLANSDSGEPLMEELKGQEIVLNASDGFGLMLPSLAERWSEELGLGYVSSGFNTRAAYEKGMVFTFDFVDFAEKIAGGNYVVKDAWGNDVDIRNVELVLTVSMLKLWDSYSSCDDYLRRLTESNYTFGVTKACPEFLENDRTLNYQFVQSYDLNDDDIEELIAPTITEIRDVLGGDWAKTVLFLKGSNLSESNIDRQADDIAKAIMVDHRMVNDPYIQGVVYQLIKGRIESAKVGKLNVHGNYSIVSGDPYALCQSIFGLKVTGLLCAGEIYNKYWSDCGAEGVACFRAPMTSHANIRLLHPISNDAVDYWYKYIKTATIINAWDTVMIACNGCDFDGDQVMLTDNHILVGKLNPLPAIMCAQRKADKRVSVETDFIRSNIDSFGNDIGKTTNWITSMYEVQSRFKRGSAEYNELEYRIKCGQLYQQDAIDKAKGIISKPMPRSWYDLHAVHAIADQSSRNLYRSIAVYRKPYFMRYIYPALMKQYRTYIKSANRNSEREFHMSVEEMQRLPYSDLSDRQREFLRYYEYKMPVGNGDCVMNKICRRIEQEFDSLPSRIKPVEFDYTIMKTGIKYVDSRMYKIKKVYDEYSGRVRNYKLFSTYELMDDYDVATGVAQLNGQFRRDCEELCQSEEMLCDIILDICYKRSSTKRFAWAMCQQRIITNLLERNDWKIEFPVADDNGDIVYCGRRYSLKYKTIGVDYEHSIE